MSFFDWLGMAAIIFGFFFMLIFAFITLILVVKTLGKAWRGE